MTAQGQSTLVLKINDVAFNRPDGANDYKVYINSETDIPEPVVLALNQSGNPSTVSDRYQKTFITHVNALLQGANADADASASSKKWTETKGKTELNKFLGITDKSSPSSTTEFVVSVQVALIKAENETGTAPKNKYDANNIAVIQFPLFITTPGGAIAAARGGRRRTKISKRHLPDRTRKNKFTTQN